MAKRSVFCIASSRGRADRIVHDLKEAGFSGTDLSVLFLDRVGSDGRAPAGKASAVTEGKAARPSGEIRGVLGWIAGICPIVIPGAAPLIGAGPVAAALSSTTRGGIAGGLTDFDVPQVEAGVYEGRIADGGILISVHSENPETSDQARGIFTENGAENIFTMIEVSTPKPHFRTVGGPTQEPVA
jgi:hypothetical protein